MSYKLSFFLFLLFVAFFIVLLILSVLAFFGLVGGYFTAIYSLQTFDQNMLEEVITGAVQIPGVKVNRKQFLAEQFDKINDKEKRNN